MTADLAELTATLRALMEEATPLPWFFNGVLGDDIEAVQGPIRVFPAAPHGVPDGALIVAAVNALPRLLAAAEDAERMRTALEAFLACIPGNSVSGMYQIAPGVIPAARAALAPTATEPPVKDWTT